MNLIAMLKKNSAQKRTTTVCRQSMIDCCASTITNSAKHFSASIQISDKSKYDFLSFLKYPIGVLFCYMKRKNFQFPILLPYKRLTLVIAKEYCKHHITAKLFYEKDVCPIEHSHKYISANDAKQFDASFFLCTEAFVDDAHLLITTHF